jgi:predicted enzyme related to lactoylglutathione lyase
MARVVGLGGVFYKAKDPEAQTAWYRDKLGLKPGDGYQGVEMRWRRPEEPDRQDMSLVAFFEQDSDYVGKGGHAFMLNFVVQDIEGLVDKLRADGCEVSEKIIHESYGKFAWVTDPEGVRVEIWEPTGPVPDLS